MDAQHAPSTFWRGYSSVLSVYPVHRRPRRFVYHGFDMAGMSVQDALEMDWKMIGSYFSAALKEAAVERRER